MTSIPLRWLIITPFVLLTLISGSIMYFFSTVTISNIANNIGEQYINEVENRIEDRVSDFMSPVNDILEINLNAFSNRPEMLSNLAPLSLRLYEQAKPHQQMTFISLATVEGEYIASARDPIRETKHNIAANFINHPFTMEGFYYDRYKGIGNKIITDPTFSYDPRVRPFYQDALKAETITWSDISPYYGYPTLGIGLSAPIYASGGKLLGVTATSIALIELDNYLESLTLVDNAYVFLAEKNGALIASSGKEALFERSDKGYTRVHLKDHPNSLFQMASKFLHTGSYHLNSEGSGEDFLYHVRPVTLKYGKTWLIGIIIPSSHHKGILAEYTEITIFITLMLFACIAFIGSAIAWYIGKPIQQLNQATNDKRIESILSLPQPLSKIREIKSLSQGLHLMAENLKDTLQHLEKKVSERTSDLQDENHHLLESSLTDELTHLTNRRGFNTAFDAALTLAKKNQTPLTFVIADIDYFKKINDTFGHTAGDNTLVSVAESMKKYTRSDKDILARYGGEEFVLVFVNLDKEKAIERINKIRQEFANTPVHNDQHITMSFGVVGLKNNPTLTAPDIINLADKRLYQAKNTGRNKVISE